MSDRLKIATVVVTYNRLELLKECIDSLLNQTRKIDEIFVINNSSTDGTEEWLSDQKDVTTITQPNSGGAGGFYTGIKTAYEKGYDWIWVMDDDGLPAKNALKELVKYADSSVGVLNSLVVSKSNQEELVFGIEDYLKKEFYVTVEEIKGKEFINGANFFNGTLLSSSTISKIGFPNPMFFIYGDDSEYFLRIRASNISIKTIITSTIRHPNQKHRYIGRGKFFYRINDFNSLGARYSPRNLMAICFLYNDFPFRRLVKIYLFDLFGIFVVQRKVSFALIYLYSILTGVPFLLKLRKYNSTVNN